MYIQVFMENIKNPRGKLAILNCRIDVCLCYLWFLVKNDDWWVNNVLDNQIYTPISKYALRCVGHPAKAFDLNVWFVHTKQVEAN